MSTFILRGKPIGIFAAEIVFNSIQGLKVTATKVKGKVIVTKEELVNKLKEQESKFISCWEQCSSGEFTFPAKKCEEEI
jgi:hypothetical protein